jgi:tetratricopeptide (TPR) repeat protein
VTIIVAPKPSSIGLDPKYANAYVSRGYAYEKKGDLDRAIAEYSKAIELDPKNAYAYNDRGFVYETKGDLDRAIADLDKAIELEALGREPVKFKL